MDGKWTYNGTEEGYWCNNTFDTKKEAIEHGKIAAIEDEWTNLFVGQVSYVQLDTTFDAEDIIYEKSNWLDENYDSEFEHGSNWEAKISQDDTKLLSEMLEETFRNWLEKTSNYPSSYTIVNVEQIDLTKE